MPSAEPNRQHVSRGWRVESRGLERFRSIDEAGTVVADEGDMPLRNLELSKSIALALASCLLVPSATGCGAPKTEETRAATTSRITQCGYDDEQSEAPVTDPADAEQDAQQDAEEDDSSDVEPQRLRILANVCTPENPTGEEERCANGGVPPRCEVLTQGQTSEQTRAAACAQAREDERFARPGPVLSPAQNAKAANAAERIQAFCD